MAGMVLKASALASESSSTHSTSSGLQTTPASTAASIQTTPHSLNHTPPLKRLIPHSPNGSPPFRRWSRPGEYYRLMFLPVDFHILTRPQSWAIVTHPLCNNRDRPRPLRLLPVAKVRVSNPLILCSRRLKLIPVFFLSASLMGLFPRLSPRDTSAELDTRSTTSTPSTSPRPSTSGKRTRLWERELEDLIPILNDSIIWD